MTMDLYINLFDRMNVIIIIIEWLFFVVDVVKNKNERMIFGILQ